MQTGSQKILVRLRCQVHGVKPEQSAWDHGPLLNPPTLHQNQIFCSRMWKRGKKGSRKLNIVKEDCVFSHWVRKQTAPYERAQPMCHHSSSWNNHFQHVICTPLVYVRNNNKSDVDRVELFFMLHTCPF